MLAVAVALATATTAACSMMKADLTDCDTGITLLVRAAGSADGIGPAQSDAFYRDVQDLRIYVYRSADGTPVDSILLNLAEDPKDVHTVTLPLDSGRYDLVAYAGSRDTAYQLSPSATTAKEDRTLQVRCPENHTTDLPLTPLWQGEIRGVNVVNLNLTTVELPMIKLTNSLVVLLQTIDGTTPDYQDTQVEVLQADGTFNYCMQPVADSPRVTYAAYHLSQETVEGIAYPYVRAELNTLRLFADSPLTLRIGERSTGETLLQVNLTQYLLMVREMYNEKVNARLTPQQYLDYEDAYDVTLYVTATANPTPTTDRYTLTGISVNGWVLRLDNDAKL
jgi:hypothetical protein